MKADIAPPVCTGATIGSGEGTATGRFKSVGVQPAVTGFNAIRGDRKDARNVCLDDGEKMPKIVANGLAQLYDSTEIETTEPAIFPRDI